MFLIKTSACSEVHLDVPVSRAGTLLLCRASAACERALLSYTASDKGSFIYPLQQMWYILRNFTCETKAQICLL